jgi:hypothetical protein
MILFTLLASLPITITLAGRQLSDRVYHLCEDFHLWANALIPVAGPRRDLTAFFSGGQTPGRTHSGYPGRIDGLQIV